MFQIPVCSILFPAWMLGLHHTNSDFLSPKLRSRSRLGRIIAASHTKDLVEEFGRQVRDLVQEPAYVRIFPGIALRADVKAASRWNTTKGGCIRASASAVRSQDGGPIWSRSWTIRYRSKDAYSEASRKRVVKWYPGGFRTRALVDTPFLL